LKPGEQEPEVLSVNRLSHHGEPQRDLRGTLGYGIAGVLELLEGEDRSVG
jgi:hypothetical protein